MYISTQGTLHKDLLWLVFKCWASCVCDSLLHYSRHSYTVSQGRSHNSGWAKVQYVELLNRLLYLSKSNTLEEARRMHYILINSRTICRAKLAHTVKQKVKSFTIRLKLMLTWWSLWAPNFGTVQFGGNEVCLVSLSQRGSKDSLRQMYKL